jgi:hypothetical protein
MGFFDTKISPAVVVAILSIIIASLLSFLVAKLAHANADVIHYAPIVGGVVGAIGGYLLGRSK